MSEEATEQVEAEPEVEQEAPQPVQPPRQEVVYQPPPEPEYKSPDQLVRARERAAELDTALGANGQLKGIIDDIATVADTAVRESVELRGKVRDHDLDLGGVAYWMNHDANNKDYPAAQARADYLRIRQEVQSDSQYANYSAQDRKLAIDIAARERFNAGVSARKVETPANNEVVKEPVRRVGSTRVVPRGATQAPPPPQKRMTVAEYLEQGKLPPGITEAQVNEDLK